jgi:HSP20 family protein
VDLTVEKNVLTVKAERRWQLDEDQQFLVRERPQGTFTRHIVLADGVDLDKIEARYENGAPCSPPLRPCGTAGRASPPGWPG